MKQPNCFHSRGIGCKILIHLQCNSQSLGPSAEQYHGHMTAADENGAVNPICGHIGAAGKFNLRQLWPMVFILSISRSTFLTAFSNSFALALFLLTCCLSCVCVFFLTCLSHLISCVLSAPSLPKLLALISAFAIRSAH